MRFEFVRKKSRSLSRAFVGNIIKMTPLTWKVAPESSFNPLSSRPGVVANWVCVCVLVRLRSEIVIVFFFLAKTVLFSSAAATAAAAKKSQFQQMQHKFFSPVFVSLSTKFSFSLCWNGLKCCWYTLWPGGKFMVCLGAMQYLCRLFFLLFYYIFRVQFARGAEVDGDDTYVKVGMVEKREMNHREKIIWDFQIAYTCKFMMEHCSFVFLSVFFFCGRLSTSRAWSMRNWIAKVVRMEMRRLSKRIGIWARQCLV